jgi:hypothetical protein
MKSTLMTVALLVAFVLAGCGKSEVEKKLESDLNNEVMKMHDVAMASLAKAKDLDLDGVMATQDSLAKLFPKVFEGKNTDDLKAAKEKLAGVKAEMEKWMQGHKKYDPAMNHTEVLAQLKKDKDAVTKINDEVQSAVTAATAAVESHKQLAADAAAQAMKGVKKVVKR